MNRDNARMAVYGLGGAYLLYLAWQLYSGLETAGSEKPLMIIFVVVFALAGAGGVAMGLYSAWRQGKMLHEAVPEEPSEEEAVPEEPSEEEAVPEEASGEEEAVQAESLEAENMTAESSREEEAAPAEVPEKEEAAPGKAPEEEREY